jgi:asparagine synthetase B (glutamine-hydrolysing)
MVRDEVARSLEDGDFDRVWRPGDDWVAAKRELPGSPEIDVPEGMTIIESTSPSVDTHDAFRRARTSPQTLAAAPGDFSFAVFDERGMHVSRSCGGRVPIFLHRRGETRSVATRMTDLARHVPGPMDIDPFVVALWMAGLATFPEGRSLLRDVSALGRGRLARLDRGKWTEIVYWDPRATRVRRATREREIEHQERLRASLVAHLTRELDPSGGNLLALSGGVDSSSLAALAAGTLGIPVASLSFVPPLPGKERDRVIYFLDHLQSKIPISPTWRLPLDTAARVEYVNAAPPVLTLVLHPALGHIASLSKEWPVKVLFGGEFADEICGAPPTIPDWSRQTSPLGLARSWRRLPHGKKGPIVWAEHRLRRLLGRPAFFAPKELEGFIRESLREEYRVWRTDLMKTLSRDRGPWAHLAVHTATLEGFVAMNWEVTSGLGIRRSLPFFERSVLELVHECHPSELIGPGYKRLLRGALAADVPAENLHRKDRGHWSAEGSQAPPPTLPESAAAVVELDLLEQALVGWPRAQTAALVRFLEVFDACRRDAPRCGV